MLIPDPKTSTLVNVSTPKRENILCIDRQDLKKKKSLILCFSVDMGDS